MSALAVTGMCQTTGCSLTGADHVKQSISRIILTRLGTRVQRRKFGADLLPFVSAPGNEATRISIIAKLATAILKWEPRVQISHITFSVNFEGQSVIEVNYSYDSTAIRQGVTLGGAS